MTGETKPQKVTIDLDEIWEPAGMGVLRGSAFAGLGTNAARDPNLTDFDLPGLLKLSYSRSTPNIEEIKVEFGRWVLANAFREAVESFALALDRSYEVLLLCEWTTTRKRPTIGRFRKFHHAGVEGKLEILHTEFQIETVAALYFRSLNKARNCLTHRMGVVGLADCTEERALVVRYRRMEFVAIEENGSEQILPFDSGGTFQTGSAFRVALRYKEEECRFALGARLLLEPSDVKHIFWTLNQCGLELKSSIIAKLQQMGVPFKSRDASIDRPVAAH
jgi:hypothetical protein